MLKEGWVQPWVPILLLVWQWLRTLGIFSCDTPKFCFQGSEEFLLLNLGLWMGISVINNHRNMPISKVLSCCHTNRRMGTSFFWYDHAQPFFNKSVIKWYNLWQRARTLFIFRNRRNFLALDGNQHDDHHSSYLKTLVGVKPKEGWAPWCCPSLLW